MTSCPQGAVVTCLAKGGPAETDGQIQIGDSLVYVDDLDVRDLMNNVRAARPPPTLPYPESSDTYTCANACPQPSLALTLFLMHSRGDQTSKQAPSLRMRCLVYLDQKSDSVSFAPGKRECCTESFTALHSSRDAR